MKLICSSCKKVFGEQKPFNNPSEVNAKCVSCLDKEKEEARKTRPIPKLGNKREVIFENGLKGKLSIAGKETNELSFWDLIVAGKKFSCSEEEQDKAQSPRHLPRPYKTRPPSGGGFAVGGVPAAIVGGAGGLPGAAEP